MVTQPVLRQNDCIDEPLRSELQSVVVTRSCRRAT
jgi:hypothetical protein